LGAVIEADHKFRKAGALHSVFDKPKSLPHGMAAIVAIQI